MANQSLLRNWPQNESYRIRELAQNNGRSGSFKVTDFGTTRNAICDFLLVINSNLSPILRRFQVMTDYNMSNFR